MLKIGELAKLCEVDVQTLRYYDKLGILCPDHIDKDSGYRYYSTEKVKLFGSIVELKELGFSLKEIKAFLCATPEEQRVLYAQRRQDLQEHIRKEKERLHRIDSSFSAPVVKTSPFPFSDTAFEDDPAVIGRWELCGVLPEGAEFTGEDALSPKEALLREIFFLPGGAHVWNYFWTKGILYLLVSFAAGCIPNEYRLFSHGDKEYLALLWRGDLYGNEGATKETRIYRKTDSHTYTEKQTFRYVDETELPFDTDPQIVGVWEAFDRIADPNDFSPLPHVADPTALFYREIAFSERGVCRKLIRNSKEGTPKFCAYTRGFVLDRELCTAEAYEIRREKEADYLILAHKSSDYSYLGHVFCYHVFRRKKEKI